MLLEPIWITTVTIIITIIIWQPCKQFTKVLTTRSATTKAVATWPWWILLRHKATWHEFHQLPERQCSQKLPSYPWTGKVSVLTRKQWPPNPATVDGRWSQVGRCLAWCHLQAGYWAFSASSDGHQPYPGVPSQVINPKLASKIFLYLHHLLPLFLCIKKKGSYSTLRSSERSNVMKYFKICEPTTITVI